MTIDEDPAAIARRLTKAQREALLWLPANHEIVMLPFHRGTPQRVTIYSMPDGLLHNWYRRASSEHAAQLTPLGLRVRAALAEMEAQHEQG